MSSVTTIRYFQFVNETANYTVSARIIRFLGEFVYVLLVVDGTQRILRKDFNSSIELKEAANKAIGAFVARMHLIYNVE